MFVCVLLVFVCACVSECAHGMYVWPFVGVWVYVKVCAFVRMARAMLSHHLSVNVTHRFHYYSFNHISS